MYLQRDVFCGQPRRKVLYLRLHSLRRQVRRGRVCCNAVKSDFFGGIKSRAEGFSPLTIPTLCRGSAAVSGERARSCRCPRAGRKPGITMAECFLSTTTPGKLHGLTPEIGMMKAWEHTHSHKSSFNSTSRPNKLAEVTGGDARAAGRRRGEKRLEVKAVCVFVFGCKFPPFPLMWHKAEVDIVATTDESDEIWQQLWPPLLLNKFPCKHGM